MCIDDAVKSRLVSSNVVRLTKAPKLAKKEIVILSKSEIARLIETAKEIDHAFMFVYSSLVSSYHRQGRSPFGEPISPTNFSRRYFKPLLKKCNISSDFTFHGLRHTHATLLLRQGVNPKIVQERLGHSSIKVTMDTYSHVLPDMQKQTVEALRGIFQ